MGSAGLCGLKVSGHVRNNYEKQQRGMSNRKRLKKMFESVLDIPVQDFSMVFVLGDAYPIFNYNY